MSSEGRGQAGVTHQQITKPFKHPPPVRASCPVGEMKAGYWVPCFHHCRALQRPARCEIRMWGCGPENQDPEQVPAGGLARGGNESHQQGCCAAPSPTHNSLGGLPSFLVWVSAGGCAHAPDQESSTHVTSSESTAHLFCCIGPLCQLTVLLHLLSDLPPQEVPELQLGDRRRERAKREGKAGGGGRGGGGRGRGGGRGEGRRVASQKGYGSCAPGIGSYPPPPPTPSLPHPAPFLKMSILVALVFV